MNREKTTAERGKYKEIISKALYMSDDIKDLLLGDVSEKSASETQKLFKECVKSHLFIDDTIEETKSFIFYDVTMPFMRSNVKDASIVMYAICHRDILDDYSKDGYFGNRADILSQMIEDCLINDKKIVNKFGIGELTLSSIEIYNSMRFYGCAMRFNIPNFR